VQEFCAAKGWVVSGVVEECGSGLNDNRKKLMSVLTDGSTTRIVVEHKDRLTRFGFNYIKVLWSGEIIIINEVETDEQDLMQDFVSLVTSFVARLYGRRRSKRRTEQLIKKLKDDDSASI
jgi:predicted site-specific integrase-resolvase